MIWILIASVAFARHLSQATAIGLTAGGTVAFGDDFINFWSAARLAILDRVSEVYNLTKFHEFQVSVLEGPIRLYHYSYPPVMMILNMPFALLPYLWGFGIWLGGGLLAFAVTVRAAWPNTMRRPWDVALYTLAMPAIFANAMTGQTGAWIAALFAGGLMAVERRPIAGGAILGLLIAKPQMAILVPVALLSGRQWTAFVSFCSVAFLLIGASAACFGANVWWEFARQVALLRSYVLEDGTGFWHLFTSVFVTVRHIPAPVSLAYAVQGAVAVIVSGLVISAWRSSAPQNNKNAVLVIGVFLVTPYVMVYDLVVTTLVPLWLVANLPAGDGWRRACLFAFVPLILSPLVTPAFAQVTGFGIGCLLLVPAFGLAVHFCARGARAASECPR